MRHPLLLVAFCALQIIAQDPQEATPPPKRLGKSKRVVDNRKVASFGLSPVAADPAKLKPSAARPAAASGALQAKVDLRPFMTEVEDQSQSNSCAANAVAGAYEYLAKRAALARGDAVGDISRLFIYYVGRKRDQVRWGEDASLAPKDQGMTLGSAIEAVQLRGACLAGSWPFDLARVNARPPESAIDEAMNYKVGLARKIELDLDAMREALAAGLPIIFGLKLTQAFFSPPASGLIATPDPADPQSASHGLHAMLMVGYSDRQRVFIVRNSWGAGWGAGGYCYLPYDYGANASFNFLGMYAIEGLTDVDLTPDDDDGEDAALDGDEPGDEPAAPSFEAAEDDDEPDEPDDFDVDDMFSSEAELRRVFAKFDADGSGKMGKAELSAALTMLGVPLSNNKIKKAMAKYDKDQSGKLKFSEFKKMQALFEKDWQPACGFLCMAKRKTRRLLKNGEL